MKATLSFLALLGVWTFAAQLTDEVFLVSPQVALNSLGQLFTEQALVTDIWASFKRITTALVLCFGIAIPLGIWLGRRPHLQDYFKSLTHFLRYIPAPTLLPLSILWFGVGEAAKVFIVFWGIFFPVLLAIRDAAQGVDKDLLLAAQALGYKARQELLHVTFRSIAPSILSTLRIAWAEAWIYLLIAEMIAADNGIGKSLIVAQRFLRVDQIFALLILLALLGIFADRGFQNLARKLFPYQA